MTLKNFSADMTSWLKSTDLENFFTIFVDKKNKYMYNLNNSLYINVNPAQLSTFVITHDMHWPLISYHIYKTTRLAWLLYKLNNVSTKDIFKVKEAGSSILYLPKDQIEGIISAINEEK